MIFLLKRQLGKIDWVKYIMDIECHFRDDTMQQLLTGFSHEVLFVYCHVVPVRLYVEDLDQAKQDETMIDKVCQIVGWWSSLQSK